MNATVIGTAKLIWYDIRSSIFIMWGILLALYAVLTFVILKFGGGAIMIGGMSPLHIYIFVAGIAGFNETVKYALGMSVRRTDYYLGFLAVAALLSLGFGLASTVFALLERVIFDSLTTSIQLFRLGGFGELGFGSAWFAHTIIFLFLYVIGWNLALLYKRFGAYSLYSLGAIIILIAALIGRLDGWEPIGDWLIGIRDGLEAALWLLIPLTALTASAYALIRRVKG